MFCPQCATQNAEGAKFCRACGQELETVALAVAGKSSPPAEAGKDRKKPKTYEDWIEEHNKGVKGVSTGASLLVVAALIGLAMALFVPAEVPWMLVWMVFFGWMACWGAIELGNGIGDVLVSKSRMRLLKEANVRGALGPASQEMLDARERAQASPTEIFRAAPPLSVTEGTTRQLEDAGER